MAYKNAYGVSGQLAAPLPASGTATIAQFDPGTAALLRTLLGSADWTFLLVGSQATAELLRVNYSATSSFVVARAQDGSPLNAHATGDPIAFTLAAEAVAAEVTPPTQVPTATGLVTVSLVNPLAPAFNVAPPNFTGSGLSVAGTWPDYTFTLTAEDTNCCGGSGSSGSGGINSLFGTGIADVTQASGTATVTVAPPNFTSTDSSVAITGTWPNINFEGRSGSSGAGTVTSVSAGDGVIVTGAPSTAPVVSLLATGVTAGTYGSLVVNAYGQLTSIDPAFDPPSVISATAPLNIATAGNEITISAGAAAEGVAGIAPLADSTAPLDPTDHTSAVNPALLASVIDALAGTTVAGYTNWSGEPIGSYSNIVSTSPVVLNIPAGVSAVVRGSVSMVNTATPGTPVKFGIGIFDTSGPTLIQGSRSVTQSTQTMEIIIAGPFNSSLALASTAIPSGSGVVSSALTVVVY